MTSTDVLPSFDASIKALQAAENEAQVTKACQEMAVSFATLMAAHKKLRAADEPHSEIDNFLAGIVQELVQYDGTRGMTESTVRARSASSDESIDAARAGDAIRRFSYPNPKVAIFDRGVVWEKKRNDQLSTLRKLKLEAEVTPIVTRRPSSKWNHVESVMRRARLEDEELKRKAEQELVRVEAEEARARAELTARAAVETKLIEAAKREDAAIDEAIKRQRAELARRKVEAERLAREARESAVREAAAKRLEVERAFGGKGGLIRRPSMPNKLVFRVSSPSLVTGNVAHEYRIKDKLTGTKGVSFVMGQTEEKDEIVQAVLFDEGVFDDHKAALWWQEHETKFTAQQRKAELAAAAAIAAAMRQGKPAVAAVAAAAKATREIAAGVMQEDERRRNAAAAQIAAATAPNGQMPGGLVRGRTGDLIS
ncbi:hypothetical protein T492DRAFT_939087 [Pavlovales sp. CCMP2436]|nr:hypothetical protein T492DRAFT_939087 [Pavlovales sp. CCMP2436]|mmetsp:Transcript_41832/g.98174  ORF Transcript_41832/g.98174 Transcript_41832/m.98174 type:complete len:426 (-) Transcript_41832:217-1494(-)